jgi:hypothetical protein
MNCAQSIEIFPISAHLDQHLIEYRSHAQHKPSARAKTKYYIIKNSTSMRPCTRELSEAKSLLERQISQVRIKI